MYYAEKHNQCIAQHYETANHIGRTYNAGTGRLPFKKILIFPHELTVDPDIQSTEQIPTPASST